MHAFARIRKRIYCIRATNIISKIIYRAIYINLLKKYK